MELNVDVKLLYAIQDACARAIEAGVNATKASEDVLNEWLVNSPIGLTFHNERKFIAAVENLYIPSHERWMIVRF